MRILWGTSVDRFRKVGFKLIPNDCLCSTYELRGQFREKLPFSLGQFPVTLNDKLDEKI